MAPAQSSASGGGSPEGGGMGIVWAIAGIFLLIFGLWYFAHTEIVKVFFYIKLFEISAIQFFANVLGEAKQLILKTNPSDVSFQEVISLAGTVGYYLRFPVAVVIILMGILLYFKSSTGRFRQTYNMKSLLNAEIGSWRQEIPTLGLDLVKEDIDKGAWAMALSPMGFAKKYKLLKVHQPVLMEGQLRREAKTKATVIKERADRLFTTQLGKRWEGVGALNLHTKALYAAFAAKAARKTVESREFLNKIAASSRSGKPVFAGVNSLLALGKDYPGVVEVTQKHGYVLTVMASMIQLARTDGVLPSADFLWLKPLDRRLWFMLNAVGRQVVTTEVAGPFAHWLAEKEVEMAIKTPMIEEATKALEEAIENIVYKPDDTK
jgi:intracellular multiplication protein IcmP